MKDKNMKRWLIVMGMILCFVIGIGVSNLKQMDWLKPYARDTLETCKADKALTECHIEWVYDGLFLVDVDVVGRDIAWGIPHNIE